MTIDWTKPVRLISNRDSNTKYTVISTTVPGDFPVAVMFDSGNPGPNPVLLYTIEGKQMDGIRFENVLEEEWVLKYNKIPDGPYLMGTSIFSSLQELKYRFRNLHHYYNSLIAIRLSDGKTEIIK